MYWPGGAFGGRRGAGKPYFPVQRSHRAQIHFDAFRRLESEHYVEPYRIPAEHLAGEWQPLDICQFHELFEGVGLRVEGTSGVAGPVVRLDELEMLLQNLMNSKSSP